MSLHPRVLLISIAAVSNLSAIVADDLVVYKETLISHTTVQTDGRRSSGARPPRVVNSATHSLALVVSLVPRETVVDAASFRGVSETEKKAARNSVEKCLKTDAVGKPLSVLRRQLSSRGWVSREPTGKFYKTLDQCLELSRLDRFDYSAELQQENIAGGLKGRR